MSAEVQTDFEDVRRRLLAMEAKKPATRVGALISCALHFVDKGIEEAQSQNRLPMVTAEPVHRRD